MNVTITLRDAVNCNVQGLSPKHRDQLFEDWAIKVHNCHFFPAVKQGKWDGRINFIKKTGNTYINLLEYIIPWILDRDYTISVVDNRPELPIFPTQIEADVFSEYGIHLRWYQVEAVNTAIDHGNGLLILATAAGKSLINAALVNAYTPLRSVTIVPNTDLVTQTTKTFRKVGLDAGVFYSKKKEVDAQHIVSTWQSLKNHTHILNDVGVIVVDEVHGGVANALNRILTESPGSKIPFRFGLTGTMPKPKSDIITLNTSLGTPIYTVKAKQLMDEGFLSRLHIHVKQMQDTPDELKQKRKIKRGDTEAQEEAWRQEKKFLSTNKHRLKRIAGLITDITAKNPQENILILIDSIDAGKAISKHIGCKFINGNTKTEERTQEYENFEVADGKILMATFGIAKAGIDITKVHSVILIDAGKAFTKIIQSVGRGLRKNEHKSFVNIYDICSNSYYSNKHMNERVKYYDDESYPYEIESVYLDI